MSRRRISFRGRLIFWYESISAQDWQLLMPMSTRAMMSGLKKIYIYFY
uniref:Uncharacterized protein n=1 Tax=Anguilla anguilla TaxID=7936 RepID=A0A0E9QAB7_ANGAN